MMSLIRGDKRGTDADVVEDEGQIDIIDHFSGDPKMKILSHPQVVPNLFEFISSVEHKIIYFEKCLTKPLMSPIDFLSM